MSDKAQLMPRLAMQLGIALLTSAMSCVFLFIFSWQLPLMGNISVPVALSFVVLLGLALTVLLCLFLRQLPEFKTIARINPERQAKIMRLLRADAYTYLLAPLMVFILLGWRQVGNPWLLWLVFLLLLLTFKIMIFMELIRLRPKK